MKSPYEAIVWIAGMATGCLTFIKTNMEILWTGGWLMDMDKFASLFFGCLVAFSTGFLAVIGKRWGEHLWDKYFNKKKKNY